MILRSQDPLSLQVANAANTVIGEALEAADMQPGEQRRGIAGIDPAQRADGKILREIYRAAPDRFEIVRARHIDIAQIGEALGAEELLGGV